jgi:hypothetical protein
LFKYSQFATIGALIKVVGVGGSFNIGCCLSQKWCKDQMPCDKDNMPPENAIMRTYIKDSKVDDSNLKFPSLSSLLALSDDTNFKQNMRNKHVDPNDFERKSNEVSFCHCFNTPA